jgi:hypothetical protein
VPQVTGGVFSPNSPLAAEVRPPAAAGIVVVAVIPSAVVSAVMAEVDAAAETAVPPLASPAAAGVAAVVVEPGSYSAP